jgi:hypothetical protein
MPLRKATHSLWFIAKPSDEIGGVWQAHCLDMDIVEQGSSMEEAIEAAATSAAITIEEDLQAQEDPYRRRAPEEFWDELDRICLDGQAATVEEIFEMSTSANVYAALNLGVEVTLEFAVVDGGSTVQRHRHLATRRAWRRKVA